MGQKWGNFPDFDDRWNQENRSAGQWQYLVPVCDFHQNQLDWDQYIWWESQTGILQILLPMQLYINHLVEWRYYHQSAIGFPNNCLQEVFRDYFFGGGFCVGVEFCLYWVSGQYNYCLVELSPLNKVQSNGSHGTVFLTLGGRLLAEIWSSNLILLKAKLLFFCRNISCIWCTIAWHFSWFYRIVFWFSAVILLRNL